MQLTYKNLIRCEICVQLNNTEHTHVQRWQQDAYMPVSSYDIWGYLRLV